MKKICWTCDNFTYDWSTGTGDCRKADDMTEELFEKHFVEDHPDCPCWKEEPDDYIIIGGAK